MLKLPGKTETASRCASKMPDPKTRVHAQQKEEKSEYRVHVTDAEHGMVQSLYSKKRNRSSRPGPKMLKEIRPQSECIRQKGGENRKRENSRSGRMLSK